MNPFFVEARDIIRKMEEVIYENYSNPRLANYNLYYPREASRGLVFLPNGNILAFLKPKIGQYKLPGGGKEGNETPEETFRREVLEETGYTVKNLRKLGITKGFTQVSHVFVADVDKYIGTSMDKGEISEDARPIEVSVGDYLEKCREFLERYREKSDEDSEIKYAITSRDYYIVKHYRDKYGDQGCGDGS